MLAKSMGEKIYERRATRGLAAAARLQVHFPCTLTIFARMSHWNDQLHGTQNRIYWGKPHPWGGGGEYQATCWVG